MAEYSAIESLPVELHHYILRLSPDPPSLRSLALSCRAFYKAFVASEKSITTAVLSRHIHPQVQHEAAAALVASRLPASDSLAHSAFVEEHLASKDTTSCQLKWSLADALPAYRLYTHVDYFSQALTRQLLSRPPFQTADSEQDNSGNDNKTEGSLPTPSTAELHRFERALYRFEICGIFYGLPELDDRCWDSWFNKLPKFELEQLICLNDLFTHLIAPDVLKSLAAFNDLLQHDVSWGYFRIALITNESDALAQDFVSRGLETIHALVLAETFDQRRRMLHKGDNPGDQPFGSMDFICESLQWTHSDTLMTGSPISELPTHEKALALGIPTYPDIPGDPGPSRVFELVQNDSRPNKLVAQVEFRGYRRWGYVFWDEARLEKLGALTLDGLAKLRAPASPLRAYSMLEYSQLRESRARRSEIWRQGGTGWWSEDDESKVVWREKKSP